MKILLDTNVLVSAAELVEAVGADPESINNWIRRDIITVILVKQVTDLDAEPVHHDYVLLMQPRQSPWTLSFS